MKESDQSTIGDIVFVVLVLLITSFSVWGQLLWFQDMPNFENRELADISAWTQRLDLLTFPSQFEKFFEDHFPQRNRLAYWVSSVKINGFKETSLPQVIIGRENWLYYTAERNIEDYEHPSLYTPRELAQMQQNVDRIQTLLEEKGILFFVVIAPNKETIYPEYLPSYVRPVGSISRLDQIAAYFSQHASTPILDLRTALKLAKAQQQVYYRTDTHWNSQGAYAAWREIHSFLSNRFPDMKEADPLAFTSQKRRYSGDLARLVAMPDIWEDDIDLAPSDWNTVVSSATGPKTTIYEIPSSKKPRLVIFGDSFTPYIVPFLLEDFGYIRFEWSPTIDLGLMEQEKPAIVVWLMVERYKDNLMKEPDRAGELR